MNEDQNLQELFQRIESKVTASDHLRTQVAQRLSIPRKSRFKLRLAMAGGLVGVACFVGGVIVLLPSASAAGAYRRIEAAIRDAKYMHVLTYGNAPGKPRRLFNELFYSNGAWRIDGSPGTLLARTYLRVGGDQWLYLQHSDVSVKEPFIGGFLAEQRTALEFAESMSDEGRLGSPRDFSVEPRPDENNRAVYAILATREGTPYHFEMIVDNKTNLPIRTTFSGESPDSENYRIITADYSFGDQLDPRAFSPKITPTTKLLNMGTEAEALKSAWEKPIKSIREPGTYVDVRDISVNQEGDLFIACSFGGSAGLKDGQFPKNLLPDSVKDDQGRAYFLVETVSPGGTFGDTRARDYFKIGNDNIAITEWAPIVPSTPWKPASKIDVTFALRTWTGSPTFYDWSVQSNAQFTLPPPIPEAFPAYSNGMLLDDVHQQFKMIASEDRAQFYERKQDFAQAARWYREAAEQAWPLNLAKTYKNKAARCQQLLDAHPAP